MKKIIRVVSFIITIILILLYVIFVRVTAPKSDYQILKAYKSSEIKPILSRHKFKGFEYRKIVVKHDTVLPTLVFVHGTIGSIADFSGYLSDTILQNRFNMVAYDRIGYNYQDKNTTRESIFFEQQHLQEVISDFDIEKLTVVGYSYGGPIVLSLQKKVRRIILLAPAVYSKVEPVPWLVNLYKSYLTRWLIPKVWQQACKEKLSHKSDLKKYEKNWCNTVNTVVSIHGTSDWIVPISNSFFLQKQFKANQFDLLKIKGAGHGLVWSQSDLIKKEIIKF